MPFDFGAASSAAGDIFGAFGDFAEAGGYKQAASLEKQSAGYMKLSGDIQLMAEQRKATQIIGEQTADVGGNGLTESGSALDVMRASHQQASLDRGLTEMQTNIDVNSELARSAADTAQASAKQSAGVGGLISGALGIAGTVASLFAI